MSRHYFAIYIGMFFILYAMIAFSYVTWPDATRGVIETFLP